ncbi:MAG TPA: VWA domain-containing protein [Terracidiphilus sp.]|nr:VWA domain-containing protein [Terracidiphilus sp.]
MKAGWTALALAALVSTAWVGQQTAAAQQQTTVPDAPKPQTADSLKSLAGGTITPGLGAGVEKPAGAGSASTNVQPTPPPAPPKDNFQTKPPEEPMPGENVKKLGFIIRRYTNFVQVPVTVKDSKGRLVAGLTWRDFQVYEDGARVPLSFFTVSPYPLSVAFVIDRSLPVNVMTRVNDSLAAISGALTPYDEAAVFTYGHGAQEQSGFTGGQSARLPAVLAMTKATGTEQLVPINSGPMSGCAVYSNGNCVDPNVQPGLSAGDSAYMSIPKEIHTLNDAILAAAKELSSRPKERRRIIYVISDGKEYGSKAKYKDVIRYLQTNQIGVYGTLVGDSAMWGEGFVSRLHLPFTMYDNILAKYTFATGGSLDAQRGVNGIELSYQKITEEARTQYTLGYLSHQPILVDKFHTIDVRVDRPSLDVHAKRGYYPTAEDLH